MTRIKSKIILFVILAFLISFFSNNFGLIDIEKTAIITAIAIDYDGNEYTVNAQVAVPEASDKISENQKAQITGKGSTVGQAIKNTGDISGWYPHLSFCNLLILGKGFNGSNVIRVLDYFSKTLRVQDSTVVVFTEEKASDILNKSSPLDNISSFAIQKILLKSLGFDKDVATIDIRSFTIGYYSKTKASYMPIIKLTDNPDDKGEQGSSVDSSGQSGQSDSEKKLFNAKTTALFLEGKKVATLNEDLTLALCLLTDKFDGSVINIDNISTNEDSDKHNYLITVLNAKPKIKVTVENGQIVYNVDLKMYCKISDQNANQSDSTYEKNKPLPKEISNYLKEDFTKRINDIIALIKETKCDFLEIKEKLYRFKNKEYSLYQDDYLERLTGNINISVSGQK